MMIERIKQILSEKQLSASRLADMIGVPRSTISHILSGRNNPSLELVQKILDTFPDIPSEWLVRGQGLMTVESAAMDEEPAVYKTKIKSGQQDIFASMGEQPSSDRHADQQSERDPENRDHPPSSQAAATRAPRHRHETDAAEKQQSPEGSSGDVSAKAVSAKDTSSEQGSSGTSDDNSYTESKTRGLSSKASGSPHRRMIRLVALYDDGSFFEYLPAE